MNAYEYYRRMAGLSQAAAAKKIGVNQSAVSQWENGETAPRAATLPKVAAVYNVPLETLITQKGRSPGLTQN